MLSVPLYTDLVKNALEDANVFLQIHKNNLYDQKT